MRMSPDNTWKELYTAAILEIDRTKMLERIRDAQMAICDRAEDLDGGGSLSERTALARALRALGELRDVYASASPPEGFQPKSLERLLNKSRNGREAA